MTMSTYKLPVIYFCLDIKSWKNVYNWIRTETLTLIHMSLAYEVFMKKSFFHMGFTLIRIGDILRERALTILM